MSKIIVNNKEELRAEILKTILKNQRISTNYSSPKYECHCVDLNHIDVSKVKDMSYLFLYIMGDRETNDKNESFNKKRLEDYLYFCDYKKRHPRKEISRGGWFGNSMMEGFHDEKKKEKTEEEKQAIIVAESIRTLRPKRPSDIDISEWNLESLENAENMFLLFEDKDGWYSNGEHHIRIGDISKWRTPKLKNAKRMFFDCSYLRSKINIDLLNVEDMTEMFISCKYMNGSNFNFSSKPKNLKYAKDAFGLTLDLGFDTSNLLEDKDSLESIERMLNRSKFLQPKSCEELIQVVRSEISRLGRKCSLNHIDVSKIEIFDSVLPRDFEGDVSEWDLSNAKVIVDLFNSGKVLDSCHVFSGTFNSKETKRPKKLPTQLENFRESNNCYFAFDIFKSQKDIKYMVVDINYGFNPVGFYFSFERDVQSYNELAKSISGQEDKYFICNVDRKEKKAKIILNKRDLSQINDMFSLVDHVVKKYDGKVLKSDIVVDTDEYQVIGKYYGEYDYYFYRKDNEAEKICVEDDSPYSFRVKGINSDKPFYHIRSKDINKFAEELNNAILELRNNENNECK